MKQALRRISSSTSSGCVAPPPIRRHAGGQAEPVETRRARGRCRRGRRIRDGSRSASRGRTFPAARRCGDRSALPGGVPFNSPASGSRSAAIARAIRPGEMRRIRPGCGRGYVRVSMPGERTSSVVACSWGRGQPLAASRREMARSPADAGRCTSRRFRRGGDPEPGWEKMYSSAWRNTRMRCGWPTQ